MSRAQLLRFIYYRATDIPTATRDLQQRGISVRVGMEATGYSRWFERLLAELGIEVWIGDAAKIKTKRVRKQKTDRQDAQLYSPWL
jgi:transposase